MSALDRVPRRFRRSRMRWVAGQLAVVAERLSQRLLGLALLGPEGGRPLLLERCRSVHTFGMRFAIDVLFLDAGGGVMRVERAVPPGRLLVERRARAVLEVPVVEQGPSGPRKGGGDAAHRRA